MNIKIVLFFFLSISWCISYSQIDINDDIERDVIVGGINIVGNTKTKKAIIYRELEFQLNDIIPFNEIDSLVVKSKSNLINSKLFNFAKIETSVSKDSVYFDIGLTERWYTWVFPIFEVADGDFNTWWKTKNFDRVDYGLLFIQENFRGRREIFNLKAISGFNEYLNIDYEVPYINKSEQFGFRFETEVSRRHETSVMTRNDELVYYNDDEMHPYKKMSFTAGLLYRRRINVKHALELHFDDYFFADTLQRINPDFLHSKKTHTKFFSLEYVLKRDFRDVANYPLHGYYFDLFVSKIGLGIVNEDVDFIRIKSDIKKFWKYKKRWFFASGFSWMYSTQEKQPYFLNLPMGLDRYTVRSYEYNVINGNSYCLLRNNLKFALVPTRTAAFDFIPLAQFKKVFYAFYLNYFVDYGYVHSFQNWEKGNGNHLLDKILMGSGVGLDFVTYYDKVLRVEYSWHDGGEGGFFVHFIAPI